MRIGTGLTGLAVSGAVFFALSTSMREASPTVPARAEDRGMITGTQVLNEPRTPAIAIEGASDPLVIREAHSDGGYWYWQEQQPAR
jgi:hypothetical protein